MSAINSYVVRAGTLRRRLAFQTRSTAQDASGQPANVWTTAFIAWGDIEPMTGRELIAAAAVQSAVTHMVTVRWRPELSNPQAVAAMRILYGTRIFNIHAAMNEDERNRVVSLMCEEGLNNG